MLILFRSILLAGQLRLWRVGVLAMAMISLSVNAEPRLSGIFTSSSNDFIAIIETAPGDTLFIRKGDVIDLINLKNSPSSNSAPAKGKVLEVTRNLVVLQVGQKQLTLTLKGTLTREGTFVEGTPEEKAPTQLVVNASTQDNLNSLVLNADRNDKAALNQQAKINALLALPKDAKISRVGGETVSSANHALSMVVKELNKKYGVVTVFADTSQGEQRVYLFPEETIK